jgi:hypothetical protein
MKVTYDEKTNSKFTPFRLILKFETPEDLETFNGILSDANTFKNNEGRGILYLHERSKQIEMINYINDVINLKNTK